MNILKVPRKVLQTTEERGEKKERKK